MGRPSTSNEENTGSGGDADGEQPDAVFVQEGLGIGHEHICPFAGVSCAVVFLDRVSFPCKHCPQESSK